MERVNEQTIKPKQQTTKTTRCDRTSATTMPAKKQHERIKQNKTKKKQTIATKKGARDRKKWNEEKKRIINNDAAGIRAIVARSPLLRLCEWMFVVDVAAVRCASDLMQYTCKFGIIAMFATCCWCSSCSIPNNMYCVLLSRRTHYRTPNTITIHFRLLIASTLIFADTKSHGFCRGIYTLLICLKIVCHLWLALDHLWLALCSSFDIV